MKTTLALLFTLAAVSGPAVAQLGPGADAPEIEAKEWFNSPPGTSLAELDGRVVFVEFWATW